MKLTPKTIFSIILSILIVPIVRILRPFVLVRFSLFRTDRMGHFAGNTELYLCERDCGMNGKRCFDFFYHNTICNQQLYKMWKQVLHISPLARYLDKINRCLPGGKKHIIPMPSDRDTHNLLERIPPHLYFTAEEEQFGLSCLEKMGISSKTPFICMHSRGPEYLKAKFPEQDFTYHDYRNSCIANYLPAANELTHRGNYIFRMGAVVKDPLETTNPAVIDYAKKYRTDFLDVFLGAKCRFYLGESCGINAIPMIFRRPLATVNMIPLEIVSTWGSNDLFIPKKLWLKDKERFMTFREIFETGAGKFSFQELYIQHGLEVIDNTPEEIIDLSVEMDERLKGTWKTTKEDKILQQRFWAIFPKSDLHGVIRSRIGAKFLRQNRDLLE